MLKQKTNKLTSESFEEGDTINKKIAIYYRKIPWGIANAVIYFENLVYPPRKYYNHKYIRVEADYAGKKFIARSVKGEIDGALMNMKIKIENYLKNP